MASPEIALLLELVLDLKKDLSSLSDHTAMNTAILDEHMKRTELNEQRLERLEKRDQMFNGFVKISIAILGVAGTIAAIVEAIHSLR